MLQSDPPGAEVWQGGQHIGHTPLPIGRLGEVEGQKYELRKENYRSASWIVPMDLQDTSRMISLEPRPASPRAPSRPPGEKSRSSGGEIRLQR
jgi:hypothetical protein